MNYKQSVKFFLIISITFITFLPIINILFFFNFNKTKITISDINKKALFSTNSLESVINYSAYKIFNTSMIKDKVIVGKEDFLFLGNNYSKILDQTRGVYRPSKNELENWTDKIKKLQKWYEDQGIKFVIVIAPNKHSIYQNKLPNWMEYNGKTITDDIVELSELKNINLLDLRVSLNSFKMNSEHLLYQKSDTHWNNIGASIAYKETLQFLSKKYNANIDKLEYDILTSKFKSGDLSEFLKIDMLLPSTYEDIYKDKFPKSNIAISDISNNLELKNTIHTTNKNIFTHKKDYFIKNSNGINNENLLFICDSFSSNGHENIGNSILYNETYKSVVKMFYHRIQDFDLSKLIDTFNVNTVIYQIVERDLYSNLYFEPLKEKHIYKINDDYSKNSKLFDLLDKQQNFTKNNHFTIDKYIDFIDFNVNDTDPNIILNEMKSNSKNVILSFELDSPNNTNFQLFYKETKESNYNEEDSYRINIKEGNNKFNLLIPSTDINNGLRVDMVSSVGKYRINKFEIYDQ